MFAFFWLPGLDLVEGIKVVVMPHFFLCCKKKLTNRL